MRSLSVVLLLLGALISCAFVEAHAQVNFSPAWGKRAAGAVSQTHDNLQPSTTLGDCKLPFDGVVRILRLIQVTIGLQFYRTPRPNYIFFRLKQNGY